MPKTIAVDFDGVIHRYSKGWNGGKIYDRPMPGAIAGLRWLLDQDFAVFVFTSRTDLAPVAAWLNTEARGLFIAGCELPGDTREFWDGGADGKLILVTNRKLPAVAYIDDRGIRFTAWEDVLLQLREAGAAL